MNFYYSCVNCFSCAHYLILMMMVAMPQSLIFSADQNFYHTSLMCTIVLLLLLYHYTVAIATYVCNNYMHAAPDLDIPACLTY